MFRGRLLRLWQSQLGGQDVVWAERGEALVQVLLTAVLTGLGARIAVPLPGTPVPMTLQVLAVLLAGLFLGGKRGALSQVLYLAAGAAGLPVFASGMGLQALLGPAGGYLIAFPGVAFIAGVVSRRFSHLSGQLLAAACGVAALYAGGTLWLAVWLGATAIPGGVAPMVRAWQLGVMPFVLVDLAKGVLAALVADRGRGLLSPPARRRDER